MDEQIEEKQRLDKIFETMNVPILRKDDYMWLLRNLGIGNFDHPNFSEAIAIIRFLASNKQ